MTVTPVDDTAVEPDETVVVTLRASAAYTVGAASSATVTIQSDDVVVVPPTATIAATDPIGDGTSARRRGQYTVTRTGATTAALTVNYTVGGTATAGSDYAALTGSVQIPAGAAAATVTVTPVNDSAVEPDETVVVTLSASAATRWAGVERDGDDPERRVVVPPTVTIAATDAIGD